MTDARPSFLSAFLKDLWEDVSKYGCHKVIPVWLISFGLIGAAVGYLSPNSFWAIDKLADRIALFAGVLTFNGLMLALSWSAFAKIYEMASAPGFSKWLETEGLLNTYYFFVDFIHYAQIAAVLVTFLSLMLSIILPTFPAPFMDWANLTGRISLAATITFSLYAMRYAIGSVRIMQDLVINRNKYESLRPKPVIAITG